MKTRATPRKVVIDTDFGTDVDDAIAVALAMASDEIEVQAFTVVGRQSIFRKQMLENFLSSLGADCAVPPVYAGWDAPPPLPYGFSLTPAPGSSFPSAGFGTFLNPLGRGYQFNWFGDEGTLDPNSPTHSATAPTPAGYSTFEAGEHLMNLLSSKDVDFIGLGPLTNLYHVLTNPNLVSQEDIRIPNLTVMGVHLQPTPYPDDTNFVSVGVDYNLASDVVSALYILNETATTTGPIDNAKWVTADVTLRTWFGQEHLTALNESQHPFLIELVKMINEWTPIQTNLFKQPKVGNVAFLHDPLALACSFDDSWCNFQNFSLELELTNTLGLRWIQRKQGMPGTIQLNCAVAVKPSPSGQTFQDWLVERLLNRFS
jgi:inosine-uridine nucleoside N-ribohydrolase